MGDGGSGGGDDEGGWRTTATLGGADVDRVTRLVRELLGTPALSATTAERMSRLQATERLRRAAEAVHLQSVAHADDALRAGEGTGPTTRAIKGALRVDGPQASRDVKAARATCPEGQLRRLGAALADGRVSRRHVDVAVAALDRVPASMRDERADEVDAALVDHSTRFPPADAAALARRIAEHLTAEERERRRRVLLEEAEDLDVLGRTDEAADKRVAAARLDDPEPDPRAAERRGFTPVRDGSGLLVATQASWEGADALAVEGWLRLAGGPRPAVVDGADGQVGLPDVRTAAQRRADAMAEACRIALATRQPRTATRPGASAHVVVQAVVRSGPSRERRRPPVAAAPDVPRGDPSTSIGGAEVVSGGSGALAADAFRHLACDPVVQRLLTDPRGVVLDLGRATRLVTASQWSALLARDRCCIACGAPPEWCEAHHVVSWLDLGPSDLSNYALLCTACHASAHHAEARRRLDVVVVDGLPHAVHPWVVDRLRRPVRADARRATDHALAHFARALELERSGGGAAGSPSTRPGGPG